MFVLPCVEISVRLGDIWLRAPYVDDLCVDCFLAKIDLLADAEKIANDRCQLLVLLRPMLLFMMTY